MAKNITNADYITITDTKVVVDGKETTKYRGCAIWNLEQLPNKFKNIQAKVKRGYGIVPIEMHVLSSRTQGQYAKPGTPSATHGRSAWVRFMFANGLKTPWEFVYRATSSSADANASYCAHNCCVNVQTDYSFRSSLFRLTKSVIQVKPKVVGQSGDITTMEIDFDNKKLQFQINASLILKHKGK